MKQLDITAETIARQRCAEEGLTYIRHELHDDGTLEVFGSAPVDLSLIEVTFDLQDGQI